MCVMTHEKNYRYVNTHDVAYWLRNLLQDMERTCVDHFRGRCGLLVTILLVGYGENFLFKKK